MPARAAGEPADRRAPAGPPTGVLAGELAALLRPRIEQEGLDLEDVEVRSAGRRRVVRVLVDGEGGISLDRIAEVNQVVDSVLDDSDLLGEAPYTLEVSSRGVDRPLTAPKHWRRNVGRLVAVTPRGGGQPWTGRIRHADDEGADLDVDGTGRRVGYGQVARAVVQVEFRGADPADPVDEPDPGDPADAAQSEG